MTAWEYMEIEVKERSFQESFEETDCVGVTFFFPLCFKDDSILSTDNGVTMARRGDTLRSESRWGQERLWEDRRDVGKLTVEGKDKNKDKGKSEGIRGKDFLSKSFMIEKQLVGFCSLVNLVNLVNLVDK